MLVNNRVKSHFSTVLSFGVFALTKIVDRQTDRYKKCGALVILDFVFD